MRLRLKLAKASSCRFAGAERRSGSRRIPPRAMLTSALIAAAVAALTLSNPTAIAQQPVVRRSSPAATTRFAPATTAPARPDTDQLIASIRDALAADPRTAVDRLNDRWMPDLIGLQRFKEVEEFAAAGANATPRDTWRLEGLQKHRVRALLDQGKPKEALAAARGLFNVCGTGFVPQALQLIGECLSAVERASGGVPAGSDSMAMRFKLQQLTGAQTDSKERAKALEGLGEPVLASIEIDAKPYEEGIAKLAGKDDYASQYALGNLYLLSGKLPEARKAFERAYAVQPPGELRYSSEGLAKVIKAEDGNLGRMNAWILSIRPTDGKR